MKRIFEFFTRLMPVWVVLLGIIAFFFPGVFVHLNAYMDFLFFCTMVGIGAVLNFDEFKPIFRKPQVVALGITAQFVIMPGLGFIIGQLLNLSVPLRLGLILVGSVPGAMASNVIAYLARTDVAYSIAVTSTATLLSPLLTPMLTFVYANTLIDIPFWGMFFTIIKVVILPLVIGFVLRHYCKQSIERISWFFPAFSTVFIALICALVVALNRDHFLGLTLIVFIAVFFQNLFGLTLGYGAGMVFRFTDKRRRTLAIEVGMQNAGLGALMALKHFSVDTAIVPAVFATWCVITASILAEIWSKQGNSKKIWDM